MIGLALLSGAMAAVVAYMQLAVPIRSQDLSRGDALYYWPVAAIAGGVVLIAAVVVAWSSLRAWRRRV
jgi:hypothetical protein